MTLLPAAPTATDLLHLLSPLELLTQIEPLDPLDLRSWDELDDVLRDDWLSVRDGRGRAVLRVHEGLGVVEPPGLLRARERRGLHRCGFRLERARDLRVWVWLAPEQPPPDRSDLGALLRRWTARDAAVRAQAVHVLRDVLGADVRAVSVVLLPPDDEDEDDAGWDDGWDG